MSWVHVDQDVLNKKISIFFDSGEGINDIIGMFEGIIRVKAVNVLRKIGRLKMSDSYECLISAGMEAIWGFLKEKKKNNDENITNYFAIMMYVVDQSLNQQIRYFKPKKHTHVLLENSSNSNNDKRDSEDTFLSRLSGGVEDDRVSLDDMRVQKRIRDWFYERKDEYLRKEQTDLVTVATILFGSNFTATTEYISRTTGIPYNKCSACNTHISAMLKNGNASKLCSSLMRYEAKEDVVNHYIRNGRIVQQEELSKRIRLSRVTILKVADKFKNFAKDKKDSLNEFLGEMGIDAYDLIK